MINDEKMEYLECKIRIATDRNEHTGSLIIIADANVAGPRSGLYAVALHSIAALHRDHGHMPEELRKARESIGNAMLDDVAKFHGREAANRLDACR